MIISSKLGTGRMSHWMGLIHAVDRFDQTRGLKFRTYPQRRIQGAMQDFLRDEDPLARTKRRRVRESATALSAMGYGIALATVSSVFP